LFDISRRNGMRAPVESNQRLYNLHLLFLRHAYVLFFYDIFFRIIIEKIDCQICACSSPTTSPTLPITRRPFPQHPSPLFPENIMLAFQLSTIVYWNYQIIVHLPSFDYVHDMSNSQAFFVISNIQCLFNLELLC
jgi:hypothetical protein